MELHGLNWVLTILTLIASVIASTGFWGYIQKRDTRQNATTKLLLGLAHDRIIFLAMSYIDRGWITKDEYEDLQKYLYKPYSDFGGNGTAERIMVEVDRLPIRGSRVPDVIRLVSEENSD